jgi:alpha-L-fucosidase
MTRRSAIGALGAAFAARAQELKPEIAAGPYSSAPESLQRYQVPDWFRDAKLGLWAHWGPQSAAEYGDWYARNMYIEGSRQYKYHVQRYGHPSKVGFKDVIPTWKAEHFDPEHLVGLYKKAGAKYFVSMGVHCDNFDMWNSTYHRWNAVKMGPKKDVVGLFRNAARNHGLRFGVTEHLWGSYNWLATNKGADKQGPYAGVPYDGNDPANWDLYHEPHPLAKQAWAEQGNEPVKWKHEWLTRIKDLVDQYHPDLLYTDGGIPFGEWGRSLVAHYYNQSLNWNRGMMDVVYTSKRKSDCEIGTCAFDVERGLVDAISPEPWQTDTCVGNWHYDVDAKYKTPKTVIDLLVDIVSRNGNMLLNFPLRSDGTLDDQEMSIVSELTRWMAINSEAIHGTRPWKIFGEGPGIVSNSANVSFNERLHKELTADDVRFTTKGDTLYAFSMGWSPRETVIAALAPSRNLYPATIHQVTLLGYSGSLKWTQNQDGLRIQMPERKVSEHAAVFKIV